MPQQNPSSEHYLILKDFLFSILLILPVALITGSLVALFLWLLQEVTHWRLAHPWMLFLLPLAGAGIYFLYKWGGKSAEKGNNLIIDQIHEPGAGVPGNMLPLVLISTIITHLFGGSAGREGTAVQMGGSLAGVFARWFKLNEKYTQLMLVAGIAAGFGAVFGTPVAGGIFALEVLIIGALRYSFLLLALLAAIIGDQVCSLWGVKHQLYAISPFSLEGQGADGLLLLKIALAAVFFGLLAYFFSITAHAVKRFFRRFFGDSWISPIIGGLLVIMLAYIIGTDYLGLGVEPIPGEVSIVSAFQAGGDHFFSWLWKLIFTVVTLGSGFKGGEVTPLFFMGATLGNTLASLLDAPVALFAALGFVAVFAGASNTPIASTVMGVELFGGQYVLFFALACFIAYLFSGHSGIYISQRIGVPKVAATGFPVEGSLEQASLRRRNLIRRYVLKYYLKRNRSKQG